MRCARSPGPAGCRTRAAPQSCKPPAVRPDIMAIGSEFGRVARTGKDRMLAGTVCAARRACVALRQGRYGDAVQHARAAASRHGAWDNFLALVEAYVDGGGDA